MAQQYQGEVDQLLGQNLDYWMYKHAADQLGLESSVADFEKGYAKGQFRFSTDKALLVDLIERYDIRLQMLGREWLASTETHSQYANDPITAACRLVVSVVFGASVKA